MNVDTFWFADFYVTVQNPKIHDMKVHKPLKFIYL